MNYELMCYQPGIRLFACVQVIIVQDLQHTYPPAWGGRKLANKHVFLDCKTEQSTSPKSPFVGADFQLDVLSSSERLPERTPKQNDPPNQDLLHDTIRMQCGC